MKRKLNIIVALAIAAVAGVCLGAEDPAPAPALAPADPAAEPGAGGGDTNVVAVTDTNVNSRTDVRSFDVMQQRNIFNPNRRPYRPRPEITTPRIQIDSFKLNGTMTYEDKAYAFFDGTSGPFRNKTLGKADKIGGYTIAEITNNAVKLTASSNEIVSLRVGMQMRRENNGPWKLITNGELPVEPSPDASESGTNDASSSYGSVGTVDEVMKRLMQRREQENKDPSTGNDKQNENN